MEKLIRLWYKIFPIYREYDLMFTTYDKADKLMREDDSWKLSKKEDHNHVLGMVFICKKERITE